MYADVQYIKFENHRIRYSMDACFWTCYIIEFGSSSQLSLSCMCFFGIHRFWKVTWFFLFQPDRVMEFCNNNDLQLIVRAHECVMDGFERFAQGHLITLFSATNYCGMQSSTSS